MQYRHKFAECESLESYFIPLNFGEQCISKCDFWWDHPSTPLALAMSEICVSYRPASSS